MTKQFTSIRAAIRVGFGAVETAQRVVATQQQIWQGVCAYLRERARAEGIDTNDTDAVRAWLWPEVAAVRGCAVRCSAEVKADADAMRAYNAAKAWASRSAKEITGATAPQRVAKPVRVPRELAAVMAQLVAQYDVATLREALKRAA